MKKTIVLFLLLSISFLAIAQKPGEKRNPVIQGRIIDSETKENIPFAIIIIEGFRTGTVSDFDGKYRLELPAAGKYILECRFIGYHFEIIPLVADSFKQYSFDISLCRSAVELLEIKIPIHQRGGRTKTDSLSDSGSVYIITGGLPDDIYRDTAKPKISLSIDSFELYHVRPVAGNDKAAALFRTGKLYQFNDSVFYFNCGACPRYALYVKRGNKLLQYRGQRNDYPNELDFCKRKDGFLIGEGKTKARVRKYKR